MTSVQILTLIRSYSSCLLNISSFTRPYLKFHSLKILRAERSLLIGVNDLSPSSVILHFNAHILLDGLRGGILDRGLNCVLSQLTTKYHRLGGLNREIYFSHFWRLESPRTRCQQGRCHSEASCLVDGGYLAVSSHDL